MKGGRRWYGLGGHWAVLLTWSLASVWWGGCEARPASPAQAEEYLGRREMAAALIEVAQEARSRGDLALVEAAYALAVELWADLPEAQIGGLWRTELNQVRRARRTEELLTAARLHGVALEERLRLAERQLARWELERYEPTDAVVPPRRGGWLALPQAAGAGAMTGVIR